MFYRAIKPADFVACLQLLPPAANLTPRLRSALPRLWQTLFEQDALTGGIVVDSTAPPTSAIAAFGLTTFLDEEFADECTTSPKPNVSGVVYERMLTGRSPVPSRAALARANAAGTVNMLILHFELVADPREPRGLAAVTAAQAGFRLNHAGYHVKRLLQEGYGPLALAFLQAAGLLLKSDYAAYYAKHGGQPPDDRRPYLMGLFREDAHVAVPGATASFLFPYSAPRFFFSPAEQRLLARAVCDEADDELAETLGLRRDALKKTWRRVYERVAAEDPALLESDSDVAVPTRGKEKRRALLRYLRYHLEEIRPLSRPPRSRV